MHDQHEAVEKILRHFGLWSGPSLQTPPRGQPDTEGVWIHEPFDDVDPMLDYENDLTD